jgi:hypothetical protein
MLNRNLIQKAFDGGLNATPVHAELWPTAYLNFLIPQRQLACPIPATWPNNVPVSVMLSVHLRDASPAAVEQLTAWLTRSKPTCVEKVKFRRAWESRSATT